MLWRHRDVRGDTAHRDARGYGGTHYTETSGRNDLLTAKVAFDADSAWFLVTAAADLTPCTDPNWMLLLLDSDRDPATGWFGYDHVVNRTVRDDHTSTLQRFVAGPDGGTWQVVAEVPFRSQGRVLELALPRAPLGWTGDAIEFDFKWADNPRALDDPITLCTSGDSAPDRRFAYRCRWQR